MNDLNFNIGFSRESNSRLAHSLDPNLQKTIELIRDKKAKFDLPGPKVVVNESVGQAAFYYEKLRNAIDYQDEHLFLKNAIKRILKRRVYLGATGGGLALLKELVWAKYFENDSLPVALADEIDSILRKYAYFRENAHFAGGKVKATELFLGFAACEIEELLSPVQEKEEYFLFCEKYLVEKIALSDLSSGTIAIQTGLAIRRIILKQDLEQLLYRTLKYYYPDWPKVKKTEGSDFARNFHSYLSETEKQIKQNKTSKIFKFVKRNSPPFKIILEAMYKGAINFESNIGSVDGFNALIRAEITRKNSQIRTRVLRSTIRGIIFILLTKIILALVVEVPYELRFMGEINYPALLTNVFLPPALMVIIGALIKIPGRKNSEELVRLTQAIVFENNLPVKPLDLQPKKRSRKFVLFNSIYSLMALGVLAAVIWLLIDLEFNFISIILFYIFVSLVSFLGFRIRSIAKEFEILPEQDSVLSGLYNFVLFPFVVIGKFLSDRWSEYNISLLFWDFIIEAPFKAIISVFESWLAFSREKREEFE